MVKKIFEQIKMYGSFMHQIDFAIEEINKLIEWLHMSKDLGFINQSDYEDCYHYAIDTVVDLEAYKAIVA